MFGFGVIEALVVLVLLSWVFRRWIGRRWPRLGRSIWIVLVLMLAGALVFDLVAWFRSGSAG